MPKICRHKYSLQGKQISRDEINCNDSDANQELHERLANGFFVWHKDYKNNTALKKIHGDTEYLIFVFFD